jgi:hypothetical protein
MMHDQKNIKERDFYVQIFVAGVEYPCGAITFGLNIQKGEK